jgi:transposase
LTFDDQIAKAEADVERRLKFIAQRKRVRQAEIEIPTAWDTGQVSQQALANHYGISAATVKRILRDSGRKVTRLKKLNTEQRSEVVALLRQNENVAQLAVAYQVSQNTIRRVGMDAGVLEKGKRKPRRSNAEYEQIEAFDQELRKRFGQGLYNLGIGLKAYHARQKDQAAALAHAEAEAKIYDPALHSLDPSETGSAAPTEAPEDPDTQLGGNDAPYEGDDDVPFQAAPEPGPEPSEPEDDTQKSEDLDNITF